MNCGVVTARNVRGVLMVGSDALLKVKDGTSGNAGLDSPWVNRKMKRDIITVDDPLIPPKDNHQITNN